jgi:hypothetical protein
VIRNSRHRRKKAMNSFVTHASEETVTKIRNGETVGLLCGNPDCKHFNRRVKLPVITTQCDECEQEMTVWETENDQIVDLLCENPDCKYSYKSVTVSLIPLCEECEQGMDVRALEVVVT